MIKVLCKKPVKVKDGTHICRFKLVCDEERELPQSDHFAGQLIDMGSIAHVINTGEMYRLNSNGTWMLQKKNDDDGVTFELIGKMQEQTALNKASIGLQRKNFLMNNCGNYSLNGVTAVVNENKSITFKGTNNTEKAFIFYRNLQTGANNSGSTFTGNKKWIPNGDYYVSGGVAGVSVQVRVAETNDGDGYGYNSITDKHPFTITDNDNYVWGRIVINADFDYPDGVTIYPMVCPADVTDGNYEPYKPSLQEQIDELRSQINALKGATTASTLLPEKPFYVGDAPEEEITGSEAE